MSYEDMKRDKWFWIMVSLVATLGPVIYTTAGIIVFMHTGFAWIIGATAIMIILLWYGIYELFQLGLLGVEWNRLVKEIELPTYSLDEISLRREELLGAIKLERRFRYSLLQRNDFNFSKLKRNENDHELYRIAGNLIWLYEEALMENTRRLCNENYDRRVKGNKQH